MWIHNFYRLSFFLLALVLFGFYSGSSNSATLYSCSGSPNPVPTLAICLANWEVAYQKTNAPCTDYPIQVNGPYCGGGTICAKAAPITNPTAEYCSGPFSIGSVTTGPCPTGYVANTTGTCDYIPPCPTAGTPAIPSGQIGYGESAEGTNPLNGVLCGSGSCLIKINNATAIPIGGGKQGNYISGASFTGEHYAGAGNCPLMVVAPTPTDPSLPKPIDTVTPSGTNPGGVPASASDCPPGSAFGQVNGVNVCAPGGTQQTSTPSTTTQNNNGSATESTTTTTKTVNADGTVTTNNTTVSTGAGGTSTTSTSGTSGGSNGLNGSNGADGKDGKIDNIDLGPAPIFNEGTVPTIDGIDPGTGADGNGGAAKTFSVGTHFTAASAGCIADRSVNVLGLTITVPLSALCEWMGVVYKVVSLMAIFAAFRILVM